MSQFLSLTKVLLLHTFTFNKNSKKDFKKTAGVLTSLILIGIIFGIISAFYNYILYNVFEVSNNLKYYLPMVYILSTVLILITGITKVSSTLFGAKDYELLESMPLKHSSIILSKVFVLYIYELVFSIFILLPAIIISSIYHYNTTVLIFGILSMFFLPTFPLLIGAILGLPLSVLFKSKYGSIITTILYVIFIIILMFFVYAKSNDVAKGQMYSNIVLNINKYYFISDFFTKGLNGSILYISLYILSHILFVMIFLLLTMFSYKKINCNLLGKNFKTNYVSKKLDNSSIGIAIIKKDLKTLFSNNGYLLNSLVGGIVSILMVVIMYISFTQVPIAEEELNEIMKVMVPYMAILICFGIGMAPLSNSNISIEGGSFWIIKTAPIKPIVVVKYKVLLSILINIPFSIISSVLSSILFKADLISAIFIVLVPLLFIIFISVLGMNIQLSHPKLNYKNIQEVYKNSFSVVILMLLGFLVEIAMVGLVILFGIYVNLYIAYVVIILLLIMLITLLSIYLYKTCDRKYRNFN